MNTQGLPFYAGVSFAGIQLARTLYVTNFDSRASCWEGFKACGRAGAWIWTGALADYAVMLSGIQIPALS
jgi:4-hydroxybenzoate polyprenyltransferase